MRVRSQKVPSAEPPAVQWSPQRTELRSHWRVPVGLDIGFKDQPLLWARLWSGLGTPPCAAPSRLWKWHSHVLCSSSINLTPLLGPMCLVFSDLRIRSPERALASFRVWSRDISRAEVIPVPWSPWRDEMRAHRGAGQL